MTRLLTLTVVFAKEEGTGTVIPAVVLFLAAVLFLVLGAVRVCVSADDLYNVVMSNSANARRRTTVVGLRLRVLSNEGPNLTICAVRWNNRVLVGARVTARLRVSST